MEAAAFYVRKSALYALVAGAVSAVVGAILGVLQDESVSRWTAYGLEIGGGCLIAFALLAAQPSAKRRVRAQLLGTEHVKRAPDALLFAPIGIVLIAAGTLVELAR